MKNRASEENEQGFVVIAVVMVVLALTILGLSLFSLSSFEAQFMRRSMDQERAFYAASSAVERVKFNLVRSGRLETSWFGFPDAAVDSARAWQWKSGNTVMAESGPLDPGVVQVRVHARVGEAAQTLTASFVLNAVNATYRRLITCSNAVTINNTVWLEGKIYEGSSSAAWMTNVVRIGPDSTAHGCTWIQRPDVASVFAAHPQGPLSVPALAPGVLSWPEWHFDAQGQQPGYFGAPLDVLSNHFAYSFGYSGPGPFVPPPFDVANSKFRIKVRGPAVWLLPNGLWAFEEVEVDTLSDGANAALIIIAGANSSPGNFGDLAMNFQNGINNLRGIPIILVSSHRVRVDGNTGVIRDLPYVTIYAHNVQLSGQASYDFKLRHPFNHANDLPGGLIDQLTAWGALPSGGVTISSQLQQIAGSWQEIKN